MLLLLFGHLSSSRPISILRRSKMPRRRGGNRGKTATAAGLGASVSSIRYTNFGERPFYELG